MMGRRINGFQAPLHLYQYAALGLVVFSSIVYFTMCIPFLPARDTPGSALSIRYAMLGAYIGIMFVGIPVYVWVLTMDPAHPRIYYHDWSMGNEYEDTRHCYTCDFDIDESTKHCRLCRKCILGFDHHCLYLNTCIGKKNYRMFFLLVTLVSMLTAVQLISFLLIFINHTKSGYADLIEGSIFGGDRWLYLTLLLILNLPCVGGFLGVFSLLLFHIYISILGLTTYDWIIQNRDREEKKKQEKEQREFEKRRARLKAEQDQIRAEHQERCKREREERERRKREGDQEMAKMNHTDNTNHENDNDNHELSEHSDAPAGEDDEEKNQSGHVDGVDVAVVGVDDDNSDDVSDDGQEEKHSSNQHNGADSNDNDKSNNSNEDDPDNGKQQQEQEEEEQLPDPKEEAVVPRDSGTIDIPEIQIEVQSQSQ